MDDCSGRSPDLRVDALFPPSRADEKPSGIWKRAHRLQLRAQLRIWPRPHRIPMSLISRPTNLNASIFRLILEESIWLGAAAYFWLRPSRVGWTGTRPIQIEAQPLTTHEIAWPRLNGLSSLTISHAATS